MNHWVNTNKNHLLVIADDRFCVNRNYTTFISKTVIDDAFLKLNDALQIPFRMVDRISFQENTGEIIIYYSKGSSENIVIENKTDFDEIWKKSKEIFPKAKPYKYTPTNFEKARPLYMGLIVLSVVFLACIIMTSVPLEAKGTYQKPGAILVILKAISVFGIFNMALMYLILVAFIIFRINRKLKTNGEIKVIQRTDAEIETPASIGDFF